MVRVLVAYSSRRGKAELLTRAVAPGARPAVVRVMREGAAEVTKGDRVAARRIGGV